MVNLVVTLVRIWGVKDTSSRHYQMLENFMDLVTAIKIANRHSVTPSMRDEYTTYMKRYLGETSHSLSCGFPVSQPTSFTPFR